MQPGDVELCGAAWTSRRVTTGRRRPPRTRVTLSSSTSTPDGAPGDPSDSPAGRSRPRAVTRRNIHCAQGNSRTESRSEASIANLGSTRLPPGVRLDDAHARGSVYTKPLRWFLVQPAHKPVRILVPVRSSLRVHGARSPQSAEKAHLPGRFALVIRGPRSWRPACDALIASRTSTARSLDHSVRACSPSISPPLAEQGSHYADGYRAIASLCGWAGGGPSSAATVLPALVRLSSRFDAADS